VRKAKGKQFNKEGGNSTMKEREGKNSDRPGSRTERSEWHIVYTDRHAFIQVRYPPDLAKEDVIRITVAELPDGELIVNLYTEPDYGYAYNVTAPELSEWGYLPE
jgi:hypothetical protein